MEIEGKLAEKHNQWRRTCIAAEVEKDSDLVGVYIERVSNYGPADDDFAALDLTVESARLLVVELIDAIATAEGNSNGN